MLGKRIALSRRGSFQAPNKASQLQDGKAFGFRVGTPRYEMPQYHLQPKGAHDFETGPSDN